MGDRLAAAALQLRGAARDTRPRAAARHEGARRGLCAAARLPGHRDPQEFAGRRHHGRPRLRLRLRQGVVDLVAGDPVRACDVGHHDLALVGRRDRLRPGGGGSGADGGGAAAVPGAPAMTNVAAVPGHPHSEASEVHEQRELGFWLYLMGDAIIFALLFMTYGIMVGNTAGGPTGKQLFSLDNAALETALLLISSMTFGFASLSSRAGNRSAVLGWLPITFLPGP